MCCFCLWTSVCLCVCRCVCLTLCLSRVVSYTVTPFEVLVVITIFSPFLYGAVVAALLLSTVLWFFFLIGFSHSHILHNFALHTAAAALSKHTQNITNSMSFFLGFCVFACTASTSQPASRFSHNHSISWFSNGNHNRLHSAHTLSLYRCGEIDWIFTIMFSFFTFRHSIFDVRWWNRFLIMYFSVSL